MLLNNYIPRISIITGIVNVGDAISETVIADTDALHSICIAQRRNMDVQVYCLESNYSDTRVRVLSNWRDALKEEHFRTSDIYYFHYGIFSEMHHLMHYVRRDAKFVVFFHNVTQPQYCPQDAEGLIHASYQQIRNFRGADSILAASIFSANQLAGYDLGKQVKVVPLFGPNAPERVAEAPPRFSPERPLQLLCCGRFAPSKGLDTLITALREVAPSMRRTVELTLAGYTEFSDPEYLRQLRQMANSVKGNAAVRFAFNQPSDKIRAMLADADAFVLPSFHEGFGMPVAEALLAGTPVICSDAGAIPEVSGGWGLTFPAGDVAALGNALVSFSDAQAAGNVSCDQGIFTPEIWHRRMAVHAANYLRKAYLKRIAKEFDALLEPTANWDESARQALADAETFKEGDTLPSRFDSAVIANVIGRKFLNVIDDGPTALRTLLAWCFGHEQSDDDIAYWTSLVETYGFAGMMEHLASAPEVRGDPARLQVSVFLRALLLKQGVARILDAKARDEESAAEEGRKAQIALIAGNPNLSELEFVNALYAATGRPGDEEAIAAHLSDLRSGKASRDMVIDAVTGPTARKAGESAKVQDSSGALPESWRPRTKPAAPFQSRVESRSGSRSETEQTEVRKLAADLQISELQVEELSFRLASNTRRGGLLGHWLQSISHLVRLLRHLSGPAARHVASGNRARDAKSWEAASRDYRQALEIDPSLKHIWVQLGNVLKESGSFEESMHAYCQALKLMPHNSDLHLQIGHLNKVSGNTSDAVCAYRKAFFYDINNRHAELALIDHGCMDNVESIRAYKKKQSITA